MIDDALSKPHCPKMSNRRELKREKKDFYLTGEKCNMAGSKARVINLLFTVNDIFLY